MMLKKSLVLLCVGLSITFFLALNVDAKTHCRSLRVDHNICYVGLSRAGTCPITEDWKSSNAEVADVSSKGNPEGGHKVIFKKNGMTVISCTIRGKWGSFDKGDVVQWNVIY